LLRQHLPLHQHPLEGLGPGLDGSPRPWRALSRHARASCFPSGAGAAGPSPRQGCATASGRKRSLAVPLRCRRQQVWQSVLWRELCDAFCQGMLPTGPHPPSSPGAPPPSPPPAALLLLLPRLAPPGIRQALQGCRAAVVSSIHGGRGRQHSAWSWRRKSRGILHDGHGQSWCLDAPWLVWQPSSMRRLPPPSTRSAPMPRPICEGCPRIARAAWRRGSWAARCCKCGCGSWERLGGSWGRTRRRCERWRPPSPSLGAAPPAPPPPPRPPSRHLQRPSQGQGGGGSASGRLWPAGCRPRRRRRRRSKPPTLALASEGRRSSCLLLPRRGCPPSSSSRQAQ